MTVPNVMRLIKDAAELVRESAAKVRSARQLSACGATTPDLRAAVGELELAAADLDTEVLKLERLTRPGGVTVVATVAAPVPIILGPNAWVHTAPYRVDPDEPTAVDIDAAMLAANPPRCVRDDAEADLAVLVEAADRR